MSKWYERQDCPYCGRSLARRDILKRHIAAKHPGQATMVSTAEPFASAADPVDGTPALSPAASERDEYGSIPTEVFYAELERRAKAKAAKITELARNKAELEREVEELEDRAYRARVEWSDRTQEASRLSIDNRMLEERNAALLAEITRLQDMESALTRRIGTLREQLK